MITQLQQDRKDSPYMWVQGQLMRNGRLVVGKDRTLQTKIIGLFHKGSLVGHSRMTATFKRIAAVFFWKGMQRHVRQFIRECEVCQRYKYDTNASPGLLQPLPIPQSPWS